MRRKLPSQAQVRSTAPTDHHRETRHPIRQQPTVEVVLFDTQTVHATYPIAAGAAGLSMENGIRSLDWIGIHPFDRAGRTERGKPRVRGLTGTVGGEVVVGVQKQRPALPVPAGHLLVLVH